MTILFWTLLITTLCFGPTSAEALVTIESGQLGRIDQVQDPLFYLFTEKEKGRSKELINLQQLMRHYQLLKKGEWLEFSCRQSSTIDYASRQEEITAVQTYLATLQYMGLDVTVRALVEYMRYFEFSEDEVVNLVNHLIGNYCSPNVSVISLRQLSKNFFQKYRSPQSTLQLPQYTSNLFFPSLLSKKIDLAKAREQEFAMTVKLFRAFCSWGSDPTNLRLLPPLLNHPAIAQLTIDQMSLQKFTWSYHTKSTSYESAPTIMMKCRNLICRRTLETPVYLASLPRSLRGESIRDDLEQLYCKYFQTASYQPQQQEQHIKKWMAEQSEEDDRLLANHFFALLTGIPLLSLQVANYRELLPLMSSSIDQFGHRWSEQNLANFSHYLYHEDSVTIERQQSPLAPVRPRPDQLHLNFDVNGGEFDRMNQIATKVSVNFVIKLPQNLVQWWITQFRRYNQTQYKEKNQQLLKTVEAHLAPEIERMAQTLIIPPWRTGFTELVAKELKQELTYLTGPKLNPGDKTPLQLHISLNYGFFALTYFHYRHRITQGHLSIGQE